MSGYPFAANPLSGLWYPPGWLLLLSPLPLGINILILLHLFGGGLGMYCFLRKNKISAYSALIGAIIFELMPKLFAHYFAGHISLVFAISWTPWLLFLETSRNEAPSSHRKRYLTGVILGIIALADVRWLAYSGLLWIGFSLKKYSGKKKLVLGKEIFMWVLDVTSEGVIAFLIASPLLLPLLQYIQLSTRSWLTSADTLFLSLPPVYLMGLIFPDIGRYAEWTIYPGAMAFLTFVWGIFVSEFRKQNKFWLIVLFLSLVFSLGENIPFMGLIAEIPGMNMLRVPPRMLFISGIAFSILTASGAEMLASNKIKKKIIFPLFATAIFSLFLFLGLWWINNSFSIEFLWGAVALILFSVIIILKQTLRIGQKFWVILLVPFIVLDLAGINYASADYKSAPLVLSEGANLANFLQKQPGTFRVYSPSYSLPQQTAAIFEIELVDGIDPMQISAYVDFMEGASGVPVNGYSVTVPPFITGDPKNGNKSFIPDIQKLGLLNVKYILSEFDLNIEGLKLLRLFGSTRVYENTKYFPRAWVQTSDSVSKKETALPVKSISISPNRVNILAEGPGLLVLSEINYPGWRATMDGVDVGIVLVDQLLRGIQLQEGNHEIIMSYRPRLLLIGVIISGFTWIFLLLRLILFKGSSIESS
ncbi:MAG: YfhO family protein [Anaerolineaceae bacterium]|nr:YfhO family protein [Anaerolineaceae bacterium]